MGKYPHFGAFMPIFRHIYTYFGVKEPIFISFVGLSRSFHILFSFLFKFLNLTFKI